MFTLLIRIAGKKRERKFLIFG